jgi:hypothetical protein
MRALALAAILLSLPGIAQAREPKVGKLTTYSMPGYTLISQDERAARQMIDRLPVCQAVLASLFDQPPQASATPTRIWIASRHVFERYLRVDRHTSSAFVATPAANYLLFNANVTSEEESYDACAEFSRLYIQTQFRGTTPAWFRQGLSTLMYLTDIEGAEAFIGRRGEITHFQWIPIEQVLSLDDAQLGPRRWGERFYMYVSQSWALVHRGLIGDPGFGQQMISYLKRVDAGESVDRAVQGSFGMSVAALNDSMRQYHANRRFRVAAVKFEKPASQVLPPGQILGRGEALELLATAMVDTGLNLRHFDEVIDAAERQSPGSTAIRNLRRRVASQ